jgi:hypothetical protein
MMLPAVMLYSMIFCLQCCKQLELLYCGSWDGKQCRLSYFSGNRPADHKIFRWAK